MEQSAAIVATAQTAHIQYLQEFLHSEKYKIGSE